MKTIASILYTYFVMRSRRLNKKIKVNFVSPSNKLKVFKEKTDEILGAAKSKTDEYSLTKALGRVYCRTMITDTELKMMEDSKFRLTGDKNSEQKEDDFCDAYLQGFRHIYPKTPEYYMKKLQTINEETLNLDNLRSKSKKKPIVQEKENNKPEQIEVKEEKQIEKIEKINKTEKIKRIKVEKINLDKNQDI